MGGSTVEGLLKANVIKPADITVADPVQTTLDRFAEQGASVTNDNSIAAEGADVVMIVVKPWLVESVLNEIKDSLDLSKQLLVVIAAGVSSEKIRAILAGSQPEDFPLFLAIPNIAIAELASMTFIVPDKATNEQTATITGLFDLMGKTQITDEKHLAAGTTLASCGIAYAMRYVRASSEGGVELGFKADDAKDIVLQTMMGAVKLLQSSGMHPEQAIDLVATPGGVTIKGLNEMEHAGFTSAVIRGLKAGAK